MKAPAVSTLFLAAAISFDAASAASVNFDDPRRALGREDNIRVDAQLAQETFASGSPVGITYQIHNLTDHPVAVADRVSDISYDPENSTITIAIGSEIPTAGMPRLEIIAPGQKKTFTSGTMMAVAIPAIRIPQASIPRYAQIKVSVLRDISPFAELIQRQTNVFDIAPLSDALFDRWLESNDTIYLNPIPIQWTSSAARNAMPSAERREIGAWH